MIIVVVVLNILISLTLLYIAWRVWQLKLRLGRLADRLTAYERCSYAVLYQAPENIYTKQQNIHNLRQRNQALQAQIEQLREIISLMLLGRQIWRRYFGNKTMRK